MLSRKALRKTDSRAPPIPADTQVFIPDQVTDATDRPRTRAWARKERLRETTAATASTEVKAHASAPTQPQEGKARSQHTSKRSNTVKTKAKSYPEPPAHTSHQQAGVPPKSGQISRSRVVIDRTQRQEDTTRVRRDSSKGVADWLDEVVAPRTSSSLGSGQFVSPTQGLDAAVTIQPSMESEVSAATSDTSGLIAQSATGTEGTTKPKRSQGTVTWDKLRERRVAQKSTVDERSEDFRTKLVPEPTRIKFKDIGDLQHILRDFLKVCEKARPNQDSYAAIEDLVDGIASWKPSHGLFSTSNREFRQDTELCLCSNEAVLQRTVMTSLIDRWQLSEIFTFNCEGQWSLPEHSIPTSGPASSISSPKPDLAIFFKLENLTADISATIPSPINDCLRPDGGQWRCFPFLFIEAKRARHDLDPARMANAYSASQALYNIYIWMKLAGESDTFFESVRVFTVVLNAQELALRCYRAELDGKHMHFRYDDVVSQTSYTRDQACKLIRNILVAYGEEELYPVLKSTFQKVVRAFSSGKLKLQERPLGKRRADTGAASSGKRSRASQAISEGPVDVTHSFGASGLSMGSSVPEAGITV